MIRAGMPENCGSPIIAAVAGQLMVAMQSVSQWINGVCRLRDSIARCAGRLRVTCCINRGMAGQTPGAGRIHYCLGSGGLADCEGFGNPGISRFVGR